MEGSWVNKIHWQFRGLIIDYNLKANEEKPIISFSGCDPNVFKNFKAEGSYGKNICLDFSGLESLDILYIDCSYSDIRVPKNITGVFWLATYGGTCDFSKSKSIGSLLICELSRLAGIVYPSSPLSITTSFEIYRGDLTNKKINLRNLINLNGNFECYIGSRGTAETKSYNLSGLDDLAPFSENCFKNLHLKDCTFSCETLEIDITNKDSIGMYGIRGVKKIKFLNSNSTLNTIEIKETVFNSCEGLTNFSNLKILTFSKSNLASADLVYGCTSISTLNLSENSIADLSSLSSLVKNGVTNLRNVILNNNSLSVENFENVNNIVIFKNLYNGGLRNVNLENNNFTEGQLDELIQLYGSNLKVNYIK